MIPVLALVAYTEIVCRPDIYYNYCTADDLQSKPPVWKELVLAESKHWRMKITCRINPLKSCEYILLLRDLSSLSSVPILSVACI